MKLENIIAATILGVSIVVSTVIYVSGIPRYERGSDGIVFDNRKGIVYAGKDGARKEFCFPTHSVKTFSFKER